MYQLEVEPYNDVFMFSISCGNEVITHGFRPSEKVAHSDGIEELKLCRAFGVGYKQQ